jgi:hypothetical protein
MHGLINRSIQCFLRDTYGGDVWAHVAEEAGLGVQGFEALFSYDDGLTDALLNIASVRLAKPRDALLEDLGNYLVGLEPLRRLLRFGGADYPEFLQSLDELPDRVRLAVPDLEMPELTLLIAGEGRFRLVCNGQRPGFGAVFAGILRAMADDYGALALIDASATGGPSDTISIELLHARFATGRQFDLARPQGV